MLDFGRKDFNKPFSLSPAKRNVTIDTKWASVRLEEYVDVIGGLWTGKNHPFRLVNVIRNTNFIKDGKLDLSDVAQIQVEEKQYEKRKLEIGDIVIEKSGGSETQAVGRVILFTLPDGEFSFLNFTARIRVVKPELNSVYLHLYLNLFYSLGYTFSFQNGASGLKNLDINSYLNIKIPLPPLEVQAQIVTECKAVDAEENEAKEVIADAKREVEKQLQEIAEQGYPEQKLAELTTINPSKTEIRDVDENTLVSFVEMAAVSNDGFIERTEDRPLHDLKKGSYTYFRENDIIIAKITPCMENGKCALATGLTNGLAMGSSEFHVVRTQSGALNQYVFALLNRDVVRKRAEQNMTGSSGHRRVPASFYENYRIPVPPLPAQQALVKQVGEQERRIAEAQAIIDGAAARKQEVLKQHL